MFVTNLALVDSGGSPLLPFVRPPPHRTATKSWRFLRPKNCRSLCAHALSLIHFKCNFPVMLTWNITLQVNTSIAYFRCLSYAENKRCRPRRQASQFSRPRDFARPPTPPALNALRADSARAECSSGLWPRLGSAQRLLTWPFATTRLTRVRLGLKAAARAAASLLAPTPDKTCHRTGLGSSFVLQTNT